MLQNINFLHGQKLFANDGGVGIGLVRRKMIRKRAAEIGLINGFAVSEVTKTE